MHRPPNGENCKRFCPTLVSKVLLVCQPSRSVSRPKMSRCWNVEFLQCCCHLTSFLSAYRLIQNSGSLSNDMREQRERVGNCTPAQSDSRNVFFITFTAQSETFSHSAQVQLSTAVALIQTNAILGISKGTLKRIIFQFLILSKKLHIMLSVMIAFDHRETVAADQQHNSLSMLEKTKQPRIWTWHCRGQQYFILNSRFN